MVEQNRLPVLTPRPELALPSEHSGSPQQKTQLNKVLRQYLKDHGQQQSYDVANRVMPVIRAIVFDQLSQDTQRFNLNPQDDLEKLFKKGYSRRKKEIEQGKLSTQYSLADAFGPFVGDYAVPRDVMKIARDELQEATYKPRITKLVELNAVIESRKPVFQKLVAFARVEAAKLIPESLSVKLDPDQEVKMVRNLIFSWLVNDSTMWLVETEDFMASKKDLLNVPDDEIKQKLDTFTKLINLDSGKSIDYLTQLSKQVQYAVSKIGQGPTSNPAAIQSAYTLLDSAFLIVNPFQKLIEFSENPHDKPSIWDEDKSMTFYFQGKRYQIPLPAVLNLGYYKKKQEDPKRAAEYRKGAELVGELSAALTEKNKDTTVVSQKGKILQTEAFRDDFQERVLRGDIDQTMTLSDQSIQAIIDGQLSSIGRERLVFPVVRQFRGEILAQAFDLLHKYADGSILDPQDEEAMKGIYYAPRQLSMRVSNYLRERIISRLREQVQIYSNQDGERPEKINIQKAATQLLEQAKQTTIVDLYKLRSDVWLQDYQAGFPTFTDEQKRSLWMERIAAQENNMRAEIEARYKRNHFNGSTRQLQDAVALRLRSPRYYYLEQMRQLDQWRGLIGDGILPSDEEFHREIYRRLIVNRTGSINSAISKWDEDNFDLSAPIKGTYLHDKSVEERLIFAPVREPYLPAKLLLAGVAAMVPDSLLVDRKISLKDVVGGWAKPAEVDEVDLMRMFRQVLLLQGFRVDQPEFDALLKYPFGRSFAAHVNRLGTFFGIEAETKLWYRQLEDKLSQQRKTPYHILAVDPQSYFVSMERELEGQNIKLGGLERRVDRPTQKLIKKLTKLDLIRKVPTPVTIAGNSN